MQLTFIHCQKYHAYYTFMKILILLFPVNQCQFLKNHWNSDQFFGRQLPFFLISFIHADSTKMNEWKRIQNYFQGSKKIQKGSIQVAIPFISCSLLITDRREKCGTYSRFPTWLCCFSAKRKISKILCKILNIMSQIFFRGPGGKTAKRKCFSIGVMILTSFPKHFGIHSSKVTSIFNN